MNGARLVVERAGPEHPWVGQLVRLDVQLWRPIAIEGQAPPFGLSEVQMPGAITRLREEAPPPDEVDQDGVHFLVQHRTLVVFPQVDGTLTVPPITARWNESDHVEMVRGTPLTFTAAYPPQSSETLVVSPELSIEQTTDRALTGLRVGDGFTRTVVLHAEDSDPLVLPTLGFTEVSGLSVYPATPIDASNAERGQISASRTFSATYVLERVGHYELPALSVEWLEPRTGHYQVVAAPELSFWVQPNPGLGLSMWGTTSASGWLGFSGLAVCAMFVTWAVRRRLRGPFAIERALAARLAERRAFVRVLRAGSRPLEILKALYVWLPTRLPTLPNRTLDPLRNAHPVTAKELTDLERAAFSDPATDRAPQRAWRKAMRAARRRLASHAASQLPFNERH